MKTRSKRVFILGPQGQTRDRQGPSDRLAPRGVQNAFAVLSNKGPSTDPPSATKKAPARGAFLVAEGEELGSNLL